MSAECGKCGSDIVYPDDTWPIGECPSCSRDEKIAKAVALLDECLNDEVAWAGEELTERMEDVREALTGLRAPPEDSA